MRHAVQHAARLLPALIGQIGDRRETVVIVVLAFQRQVAPGQAHFHLADVLAAHIELARDVVDLLGIQRLAVGAHAAQVEEQLALRLGGGHLDQPPVADDEFVDFGLDPVHGERHQPHPALGVEALDGLHQADIAFLDQVGVRQAVTQVLARHRHHQTQVRHDQFARGLEVAFVAQAARELAFLFGGQDGQAVDGGNVGIDGAKRTRVGHRQRQGVAGKGQRTTGLSHVCGLQGKVVYRHGTMLALHAIEC
ncbi:Uncharacterised protein [Bordetella pertussis]|nr:Uncharacterised protein [Bordetella pertussis]